MKSKELEKIGVQFNGVNTGIYLYVDDKELSKGMLFNPTAKDIKELGTTARQVTNEEWDAFKTKSELQKEGNL